MKNRENTRVILFSGGRTSAYMTLLLKPTEKDIVLFTDTNREHAGTYKFIEEFQAREGIQVHVTSYSKHIDSYGAYLQKNKFLPNLTRRSCTGELKIETARRYLKKLGIVNYTNYIGFRADETSRVHKYKNERKKVKTEFPLYDMRISKKDVLDFWKAKDYDLEIPPILGNCDLCFMKGKNAIIKILRAHPQYADKWIHDEESLNQTFFKDTTYRKLRAIAEASPTLFPTAELEELEPAFDCSCTA